MSLRPALTATVVVPTHDHGDLLLASVPSALRQSVEDLEVLIIGDGVSDAGRAAAHQLVASDERVQFLDRPKGARHGEALRHEALEAARSEIVVYLCDDDLWHADHVATMARLLESADVAHTLCVGVDADETPVVYAGDLGSAEVVARMRSGPFNFIPLTCFGHRLDSYRRLPFGWHPAPADLPTDLFFYRQWLEQPWCRTSSSHLPTALHFPSPLRTAWSHERRSAELEAWAPVVADEPRWQALALTLIRGMNLDRVALEERHREIEDAYRGLESEYLSLEASYRRLEGTYLALEGEYRRLQDAHMELSARRREVEGALALVEQSATWRLRARLRKVPIAGRAAAALVRLLSGRARAARRVEEAPHHARRRAPKR